MTDLTGKQKRYLRGLGHAIKPVMNVGKSGVTPALVAQTNACLLSHELIKVKVLESADTDAQETAQALAQATGAGVAQVLGKTVLLYRAHPEDPVIQLPE